GRFLTMQSHVNFFDARKIRPSRIPDDIAVSVENTVGIERNNVLSVGKPCSEHAGCLHVEIALTALERQERRCAALRVAKRDLDIDAEEIESEKPAEVASRRGNAGVVKWLRGMLEVGDCLNTRVF